jgi:hypothetical protein
LESCNENKDASKSPDQSCKTQDEQAISPELSLKSGYEATTNLSDQTQFFVIKNDANQEVQNSREAATHSAAGCKTGSFRRKLKDQGVRRGPPLARLKKRDSVVRLVVYSEVSDSLDTSSSSSSAKTTALTNLDSHLPIIFNDPDLVETAV